MSPETAPDDRSPSLVLKQISPGWYWVRKNFSLPSILTICGIIATAGSYIVSLKTRIVSVEREVHDITKVVPDAKAVAVLQARLDGLDARTTRLEADYDIAYHNAALPPYPDRRRPKR